MAKTEKKSKPNEFTDSTELNKLFEAINAQQTQINDLGEMLNDSMDKYSEVLTTLADHKLVFEKVGSLNEKVEKIDDALDKLGTELSESDGTMSNVVKPIGVENVPC